MNNIYVYKKNKAKPHSEFRLISVRALFDYSSASLSASISGVLK